MNTSPGKMYLATESVRRLLPRNLVAGDEYLFSQEYSKRFDTCMAAHSKNVLILPNGAIVQKGRILDDSFAVRPSGMRFIKNRLRTVLSFLTARKHITIEAGLFVTDEFSNGFFHWICDVLPRLEMLMTAASEDLFARTLVVPAIADYPYVRICLALYHGVNAVILDPLARVTCRDLLIIPPVAPTGNYRPHLIRSLRDRFRMHFGPGERGGRIFVSRAHAPKRRIANEDELTHILDRYDIQRIALEGIPLEDQVRLVGAASLLIGNHGAGLTNMAWMAAGSRILELRRRGDSENNCYFSLASALDLKYYYLQCNVDDDRKPTKTADFLVDPASLDRALDTICREIAP